MSNRTSNPTTNRSTLWLPGMDPREPIPTHPRLRDWYEQTYRPRLVASGRSRDRLNEISQAISRFCWWVNSEHRIMHPVLNDVTPRRLAEFRLAMQTRQMPDNRGNLRPVSARSANKTLGAIEQVVNAAAETEDLSAVRVRKIDALPQVDRLVLPDDALARIFAACDGATWPARAADGRPTAPAPIVWRFIVVMLANYGMRTQDLVAYESHLHPLVWSNVSDSPESPHHDGQMRSDGGWLVYVPDKTARAKPDPLVLPINAAARHWLDALAEATPTGRDPDRPIVPVTYCARDFYGQWRALVSAAGVKPKPRLDVTSGRPRLTDRQYKLKHLRCTAATRIENHGATLGYPGVGQLVTGHAPDRSPGSRNAERSDVFGKHYYSPERALIETLTSIPQPAGFLPPTPTSPQRHARAEPASGHRARFRVVG
jgi:integrase